MFSQTELAWSAGFFDGEGCTHIAKGESRGGPFIHLTVTQCGDYARDTLGRFQKALSGLGQIYGPYKRGPRKDEYSWKATSFEQVQAVVALLWKFMSEQKREQAKKALAVMKEKFATTAATMTPEARSLRSSNAAKALWAQQRATDLP